jgi:hypothetical protein
LKAEHEQRFAFVTEKGNWRVVEVVDKSQEGSYSAHASVVANGPALAVIRPKAPLPTDVSLKSAVLSENCYQISETTLRTLRTGPDLQIPVLTIGPA